MPANDKPPSGHIGDKAAAPADGVVMIYATFPDREIALTVGRDLVERGFAGCVNVLPAMTSVYVWQGSTETADEAVMIVKLAREGADRAVAHIVANHPYETPAVLVVPVEGGSFDYLAWVRSGTRIGDRQ
ncbi:MAG: divalent-cation tolerance protein CutA [Hyphomicrobium sp.]